MIYTSDKELHRSKLLAVMERCCLIPVRHFPSPYRSKLTEIRPNIFCGPHTLATILSVRSLK